MRKITDKSKKIIDLLAFFLCLIFFGFFVFLQSPGVTGGDSGNLVTAAFFRSFAHPPGYPLYMLLASWLIRLPLNLTPAFKVGLLSSLPAALTILVTFKLVYRLTRNIIIALLATLSLAFNYLFWLQAEIQEVFSLHLLLLFITFYLAASWLKKPSKKTIYLMALVTGLEFAHHHTFILVIPALIYLFWSSKKRNKREMFGAAVLAKSFLVFLLGPLFYFYGFLFFNKTTPVSWLSSNWLSLARLILRSDYGTFSAAKEVSFSFSHGFLSLVGFLHSLYFEFTWLGILLIFLGAFWLYQHQKRTFYFCLIWFLFTGIFFQIYAAFPLSDWFTLATVERFYLLPYPALVACLAFGLVFVSQQLAKITSRQFIHHLIFLVFFLYPAYLLFVNLPKNDFRNFYAFDFYGKNLFTACPANSLAISGSDLSTFSAFYSHYVLKIRSDLTLVSLYNPRQIILSEPRFESLRPFFAGFNPDYDEFWQAFKKRIEKENWSVCSTNGRLKLKDNFIAVPQGLSYVYQDKNDLDFQKIFTQNEKMWQGYKAEIASLFMASETYFNQSLLANYGNRVLVVAKFFFSHGQYEKAAYWLDLAKRINPDSESILRLAMLTQIRQNKCGELKGNLEFYQRRLEGNLEWPILEAIYEKECLGNSEKYDAFKKINLDDLESSDVP